MSHYVLSEYLFIEFLSYTSFAYVLWLPALCSHDIPECMSKCVHFCIDVCFLYAFFSSFSSVCFCLFCLGLFISVLYYYYFQMPVCFLIRNIKNMDLDGRGGWEDLEGAGEEENIMRIYCMKNIYSQ